jgi:hypothetical protein
MVPTIRPSTQSATVTKDLTIAHLPNSNLLSRWAKEEASNRAARTAAAGGDASKLKPSIDPSATNDIATATASTKPAEPAINIVGRWSDNWGITYDIEQNGYSFRYSASGPSCRGPFRSSGRGTISGLRVQSSYSYEGHPLSGGSCTGELFADGTKMKSRCDDSVCGHNEFSLTRE